MSLTHITLEEVGLMKLSIELRRIIWIQVLSEKEARYIQSSRKSMLQSLRLTCRTIHNDIGSGFPKYYLQNQTFSFRTLESFLKCAPLYTRAEQVLLRSVHIQFHETPDFQRYKGSPRVLYSRQNFLLDEILLPKYHDINEWIFDVSNLFSKLGEYNRYKSFTDHHITSLLRYCPAEKFTLIFNTYDGSILNCAQPRKRFDLERTDERTLHEFESDAEKLALGAQRWNDNSKTDEKIDRNSTMLILHRPTQAPRLPNPNTPYYQYSKRDDPRDLWIDIKSHARNSISHSTRWKMETWKREKERWLDAGDKFDAGLMSMDRGGSEKKEVTNLRLFEESELDRVWV